MAWLNHVPEIPRTMERIRYPDISGIMASGGEVIEELVSPVTEDKVYVAVGKYVKESKSILIWALQNSGGKKICILHVHVPAQPIKLLGTPLHQLGRSVGTKCPASSLKGEQISVFREIERQSMHKVLDKYLLICQRMGVRVEKLQTEMDSIEKGIVELISHHKIRKLVMGAAADTVYSRKMMNIESKKAIYVREQAPVFCHILFVFNGQLIYTRGSKLDRADVEVNSSWLQPSTSCGNEEAIHSRLQSVNLQPNGPAKLTNPALALFRRVRSANIEKPEASITDVSSLDGAESLYTPRSRLDAAGSYHDWNVLTRMSHSPSSGYSTRSSSSAVDVALAPFLSIQGSENESNINALRHSDKDLHHSSPPSVLDGRTDDNLYDRLDQLMSEAENAKREAFQEAVRRGKAEKDAIDAIRRARAAEILYKEEVRRRKEIEELLARENEELEQVKNQCNKLTEKLEATRNQKSLLENQILDSDKMVIELGQKIISVVELLQSCKRERDELQMERDIALREAEELRKKQGETTSTHLPQFFSEFSFTDIQEATQNFNLSLKIGEGEYGSIYKGLLCHTQVAIKMLHAHIMQGPSEYQQEVDVLSKLRHSNLVTLIGACPEAWTLIYEYLPNGSLEDRLSCKDNSPPLSWQTRTRIATELCSVLIFLHSNRPHSILHGDLKPANILLDANFVSKLSDFRICRLLSGAESSSNDTTLCCRTDPKGNFAYVDPEFLSTGELTEKSDVYSFGIILLRLLTGRAALGITKEVQNALDGGKLTTILDPLAGDWPFVQAEQLTHVALRCCDMNQKSRADLVSDVWRVVGPMRASCGGSSPFHLGPGEHIKPPHYFICPIFQEVMQDPHVAADGFTYEAEAIKGWLDSGHDTSPMTNLKLENQNLVPNHALRSAIQEWLQQH